MIGNDQKRFLNKIRNYSKKKKIKNRWCKERLTMRRKKQTRSEPIK